MPLNYNAPISGTKSSVDGTGSDQTNSFYWLRKSIIEARKDQYFMPLARVEDIPKHYGKTIKVYQYVPILDDRNVNDQGLDAAGATYAKGNLYGSSRDIGTINGKMPLLGENGGRVNRVGMTRLQLEGSIHKFGLFTEFTQESLDFDSDDQLREHLARELMNAATQLTEAALQIDLLMGATTVLYAGAATSNATVTAEGAGAAIISYANFVRLDQMLTEVRTPKHTTVITGSRLEDTKTLPAARVIYCGSEMLPHLKAMKNSFNEKAFIAVQHYAAAGTVLNGEEGCIDSFRVVMVPEMLHWAGAGANVGTNPGYRATAGKYNVYPMLVVGDDSFATIGFQTDGKTVKFTVNTRMPGKESISREDPYGETGLSSIKWYYGTLLKRPERLGLLKGVAPM